MTYSVQKVHETAAEVLRDGQRVAVVSIASGDVEVATVGNVGVPLVELEQAFLAIMPTHAPKAEPATPEHPQPPEPHPQPAPPEPSHTEEIS